MDLQDSTNQTTFSNSGAVNWLSSLQGFVDSGERVAYAAIADDVRNQPILDLGVGTGRTIPLLTALSTNYTAVDYLPIMVTLARRKFPHINIQIGDARDLSRFDSDTFALVVFSYAGIDAIDHEGRQRVLAEVHRVLKSDGLFWFSTLNKDGNGPRAQPWQHYRAQLHRSRTLRTHLSATREFLESYRNYRRLKLLKKEGEGWLIAPFAAHAFGLLTHYVTFAGQCEELIRAGFHGNVTVFDSDGNSLDERSDLRNIDFFNIVARKSPSKTGMM